MFVLGGIYVMHKMLVVYVYTPCSIIYIYIYIYMFCCKIFALYSICFFVFAIQICVPELLYIYIYR